MIITIKAPAGAQQRLGEFWERYFAETPTCSSTECSRIAAEVDPFFPYLDDLNRCEQHSLRPLRVESACLC